jgi:hypothetical protein
MLTNSQLCAIREIVTAQFATPISEDSQKRAERCLQYGVVSSPAYPDVTVDDDDLWSENRTRSHARYLHGFLFFTDWYGTVLHDPQTRPAASRQALKIIQSWNNGPGQDISKKGMAYHDETTAQRLIKLLRLYPFLAAEVPELEKSFIRTLMDETAELLADSDFHSTGNNHGMFQDLALVHYATLSDWLPLATCDDYLTLALKRLKNYFELCFTAEGVHTENTPTYHIMVSRNLALVQKIVEACSHPDSEYYKALLNDAERYATHALMPNGLYPPVSDTQQVRVDSRRVLKVFNSPEFLYASTAGKMGTAPVDRFLVLPETGYTVYRSAWGDRNATYVFFSAAYNSGYHKHSDDLSLFLRSKGVDLLSESGPYGYDYKHPFSRHAYSQFAHNSLIVDNSSLPRTDTKRNKVRLRVIKREATRIIVEGTNGRYADTVHRRVVDINESLGNPKIDITDTVEGESEHTYRLLWNLGPNVTAFVHGHGFEVFHGSRKVMDMLVSANVAIHLSVEKGKTKPRPMGWSFPKFGEAVPTEVVSVRFTARKARIESFIRLSEYSYAGQRTSLKAGWKRHEDQVTVNYLLSEPRGHKTTKLVVYLMGMGQYDGSRFDDRSRSDQPGIQNLYILDDFGHGGSYLYSDHRSTAIFESVQSLIVEIINTNGLTSSDVAVVGTSKGGTSAIIHGVALGADQVFAVAPNLYIGTFLLNAHPDVLEFMTGGVSSEDVSYLDAVVTDTLRKAEATTKVSVFVPEDDRLPWERLKAVGGPLAKSQLDLSVLSWEAEAKADDGNGTFDAIFGPKIKQWAGNGSHSLPYELVADRQAKTITVRVHADAGATVAFRLFKGSALVTTTAYSVNREVTFSGLTAGVYRVRVSAKLPGTSQRNSFTTRRVRV